MMALAIGFFFWFYLPSGLRMAELYEGSKHPKSCVDH